MNKNGEKEGKRSKAQKKDSKLPKVNKTRGSENKVPENEKAGEADELSNKFPNFSVLTEEERLVFFQALTAARRNVERRGIPTRDRFGTVHDEYLKYFDQEEKAELPDDLSESLKSKLSLDGSAEPSCERAALHLDAGEPPEEVPREKSLSPTLLLEGKSETVRESSCLMTIEPQIEEQCESVIQQDTDKVLGLYLKKKKRNEAKSVDFRADVRKGDQSGEKKSSRASKKETGERENKKKESALPAPGTPRSKDTPRFDALSAEEREVFFDTLQEARNNIIGKNPERKSEILPLDAIVRRYRGDRPATTVYTSVQEPPGAPKVAPGRRNLRVKVNLTSGDNQRVLRTKCEDVPEAEKREEQRRHTASERRRPEDLDLEETSETEMRRGERSEWRVGEDEDGRGKPKQNEKPSGYPPDKKNADSTETIDVKPSQGAKDFREVEETKPPSEAKQIEQEERPQKSPSEVRKSSGELTGKSISSIPRSDILQKGKRAAESGKNKRKEDEKKMKRKKKQEETEREELFSDLTFPDLPPEERKLVEDVAGKEDCEEMWEPSCSNVKTEECSYDGTPRDTCEASEEEESQRGEDWDETCPTEAASATARTPREECEDAKWNAGECKEAEWGEGGGANEEVKSLACCSGSEQCISVRKTAHPVLTSEEKRGEEEAEKEEDEKEGSLGSAEGGEGERGGSEKGAEECRGVSPKGGRPREEAESRELAGVPTSPKVMIVDDNVIEKIRKLIYYLEAKAGKDGRLEKEYIKLLVDYVDYLSKVLEALLRKKERDSQVHAYPADINSFKLDETTKKDESRQKRAAEMADSGMARSVSAQHLPGHHLMTRDQEKHEEKDVENKSEAVSASLFPSNSDISVASREEVTFVPPAARNMKVTGTKIRLLQDLLKKRAQFVEGSSGDLRIDYNPAEEYVPSEGPPMVKLITDEDEENPHKKNNVKFFRNIVKCLTCGAKKEEEEGIFENLKGEAVRVDVCEGKSRDPANATLNHSTMEVLKAAGRKRIIERYYNKN